MSPVVRLSKGERIVHPCGRCPACLKRKRNDWISRFYVEMKKHTFAQFVTLTYRDECIPLSICDMPSLDKRHLQAFFKALRKEVGDMKYYAIGEYGPRTHRPHYHALIWSECSLDDMYEMVLEHWHHGNIKIAPVVDARLGYIANFHIVVDNRQSFILEEGRAPEFTLSSKHLGTPSDELLDKIVHDGYHQRQGYKYSIPRRWLELLDDSVRIVIQHHQQQYMNDVIDAQQDETFEQVRQRSARRQNTVDTFVKKTRKNRK